MSRPPVLIGETAARDWVPIGVIPDGARLVIVDMRNKANDLSLCSATYPIADGFFQTSETEAGGMRNCVHIRIIGSSVDGRVYDGSAGIRLRAWAL